MAGAGGRPVIVNADHVVCIVDVGEKRSQVVTTGLSGEASISLLVELPAAEVANRLEASAAPQAEPPSPPFTGFVKRHRRPPTIEDTPRL